MTQAGDISLLLGRAGQFIFVRIAVSYPMDGMNFHSCINRVKCASRRDVLFLREMLCKWREDFDMALILKGNSREECEQSQLVRTAVLHLVSLSSVADATLTLCVCVCVLQTFCLPPRCNGMATQIFQNALIKQKQAA